ncbi:MAG: HEAT repeat domain-containing protein, partial [Myxococcota bacterium]|nr:HEAT repeat domain-containing protein [Myxococcota bacterium]
LAMQRAFGASALRDLIPLLDASDTAVREAAIRALGAIASGTGPARETSLRDQARSQLRRQLVREPDEALREEIERQIPGVGGSSPR